MIDSVVTFFVNIFDQIASFFVEASIVIADAAVKIWNWTPMLLSATGTTVSLALLSVCAGIVISLFLALMKISKSKILQKISGAYIFFFRGTPLLMQLFFIYFALPVMFPAMVFDKFFSAWLAFTLNSAAYCAEIIRAAILSIDKGQLEASKSLGLNYAQAMRFVIIPQSIRRLIPPIGNEFIMIIKDTSIVSIIALVDLMKITTQIKTSSSSILIFLPTMIIYLTLTALLTLLFNKLEKKFSVYE